MSNAKEVLSCALVLLGDGHAQGSRRLALDENGEHVKPTDPRAVKWSSVGAIHAVEPVYRDKVWADTTSAGEQACSLLYEAAEKQNYPSPYEVDQVGMQAVYQMFHCAMNLYEPPRRRRFHTVGTGGQPRGIPS